MREIIFGLYDHYDTKGYIGYFRNENNCKSEMNIQSERISKKYNIGSVTILDNKVIVGNVTILAIHPIILR